MESTLNAPELAAHFRSALTGPGWRVQTAPGGDAEHPTLRLDYATPSGVSFAGILAITPLREDTTALFIRLVRR